MTIKACIFDVGGVCVRSPLHAIRAYETEHNIPHGYVSHAISTSGPTGSWERLERGEVPLDEDFYEGFTRDLTDPRAWESFPRALPASGSSSSSSSSSSAVPDINGERLFQRMVRESRVLNPFVVGAIRALRATGRYGIAALTNDYRCPPDRLFVDAAGLRGLFDVFVSSSECGMRKPERGIYELVLGRLGVRPEEAVFLDDLGVNLKAARSVGMSTVRVPLEGTWRAVRELEGLLGERLLEEEDPVGERAKL